MSLYKLSKRGENAALDIDFLERCARDGLTPKGLRWKLKIQGLDERTEDKVEKIKKDVMIKGMRGKRLRTDAEREKAIEREMEKRKGDGKEKGQKGWDWEAIK